MTNAGETAPSLDYSSLRAPRSSWNWTDLAPYCVDLAHRFTSIGILVFFGALLVLIGNRGTFGDVTRAMCRKQTAGLLLVLTFIACDASLILTLVTAWIRKRISREIASLWIANVILLVVPFVLYSMSKAGELDRMLDPLARKLSGG
jgi:hypothetical protein